ncbi:DUF2065 domain-containing protein [Desulfothermus naphthae]
MYVTPLQLFFCALGMAFILEGMIYFLFPVDLKKFLENISEIPSSAFRNFGLFAMLIGLVIIYFTIR